MTRVFICRKMKAAFCTISVSSRATAAQSTEKGLKREAASTPLIACLILCHSLLLFLWQPTHLPPKKAAIHCMHRVLSSSVSICFIRLVFIFLFYRWLLQQPTHWALFSTVSFLPMLMILTNHISCICAATESFFTCTVERCFTNCSVLS